MIQNRRNTSINLTANAGLLGFEIDELHGGNLWI